MNQQETQRREQALQAMNNYMALMTVDTMEQWNELWAEDAVVEFPYAPAGLPAKLDGKSAIVAYYQDAPQNMRFLSAKPPTIYASTDPDVVISELEAEFHIVSTDKPYKQIYISVLRMKNGKIASYREYWNPLRVLESFGGLEALQKAFAASKS